MSTTSATKRDWGLFFAGLLVAILGIVVMAWPGLTLVMLATMAGIGFIVAGIFDIITWWRARNATDGAGWTLVTGILDLIVGAMFLIHPLVAAGVLTFLCGCFVIAYGIFAIITGIGMRKMGSGWWLMVLNGVVSIFCGIMFVMLPEFFVIYLGVFLIMRGVTMSIYGVIAPSDIGYL